MKASISLLALSARASRRLAALTLLAISVGPNLSYADSPGVGLTARFEVDFLKSIIDHHFSALRMSELAAGTDVTRDPTIANEAEGTANTPGFAPVRAKSQMAEITSMSRQENRAQRDEIMTAQRFLREWYGMHHEPAVTGSGWRMIHLLESARPGAEFDHLFLETMSRHHYMATTMANECPVSADPKHKNLMRYCTGIQHAQLLGIDEMRNMLCERFGICDYQPLRGLKGRHSGSRGEAGGDDHD